MDIATGLGLLAGATVVTSLMLMGGDLRMFFSDHAVIVIFGGSFAATLIRFPLTSIMHGLPLGARFAFAMRRTTQRVVVGGGNDSSVSGSPRGPMTCAGRIFWFSSIVPSHLLNHCYWPLFNSRPLKIF